MCDNFSEKHLDHIYRVMSGCTVVLEVKHETAQSSEYLTGKASRHEEFCRAAMKWKNKVLTIFVFPRESTELRKKFFENVTDMSFVHIEERVLFDGDAITYLKLKASEVKSRAGKLLLEKIEPNTGYTCQELTAIFDKWFDNHTKTRLYPQYLRSAERVSNVKDAVKGSGYDRLEQLIGLTETKALVRQILDFASARKLFPTMNNAPKQSLHMIFSGNPGTAKTTVARLVAQILKENDVLRTGNFVEVGRDDLVGKYVGWTAVQTKKAFERARGGVLFIDEAYSLVDDGGNYGDEAINTIVREMENMRDDIVVILAGYADKMEDFLAKNAGLRSRIGFHVSFPDYSATELYDILKLTAKDYGVTLADDVHGAVMPILESAVTRPEFGNGRYVRNMLEQATLTQSSRIMRGDVSKLTPTDAQTLTGEDFAAVKLGGAMKPRTIGFIV
jgi:AAA+ superfamily predicted ATPase